MEKSPEPKIYDVNWKTFLEKSVEEFKKFNFRLIIDLDSSISDGFNHADADFQNKKLHTLLIQKKGSGSSRNRFDFKNLHCSILNVKYPDTHINIKSSFIQQLAVDYRILSLSLDRSECLLINCDSGQRRLIDRITINGDDFSRSLNLQISNTDIKTLKFINTRFSSLEIHNTNIDLWSVNEVNFDITNFNMRDTVIGSIEWFDTIWPKMADRYGSHHSAMKNLLSKLLNNANRLSELNSIKVFNAAYNEAHYIELQALGKKWYNTSEMTSLWLSSWTNDFGRNWFKSLAFIGGLGLFGSILIMFVQSNWTFEKNWWSIVVPAHDTLVEDCMGWRTGVSYFIEFFHAIVNGILIFQLIKAFRYHS